MKWSHTDKLLHWRNIISHVISFTSTEKCSWREVDPAEPVPNRPGAFLLMHSLTRRTFEKENYALEMNRRACEVVNTTSLQWFKKHPWIPWLCFVLFFLFGSFPEKWLWFREYSTVCTVRETAILSEVALMNDLNMRMICLHRMEIMNEGIKRDMQRFYFSYWQWTVLNESWWLYSNPE